MGELTEGSMAVIPEHRLVCSRIALHLGGRPILNDVSISVASGEIVGIAGPNGAGKTTLLDVTSGRHRGYRGTVSLDEHPLDRLSHPHRVRAGLARTYQHPLVPVNLTVAETFDAARKAFRPTASRMAAEWAAEMCHLDVAGSTPCGGLETLERRKLLLACLLLRRPKFVLLDEPASGLVSSEIDELDRIIKRLAWELRIGILIVEHRLELLEAITDRVVVLDVGEVIATGTADQVFSDPVVRRAYFGDVEPVETADGPGRDLSAAVQGAT